MSSVRRSRQAPFLRVVSAVAPPEESSLPVVVQSNPFRSEVGRVRAAQRAIQALSRQTSEQVSGVVRGANVSEVDLQRVREEAVRLSASRLRELLPIEEALTFARDMFAEAIGFLRPLPLPQAVREWIRTHGHRESDKPDLDERAETLRKAAAEFDALVTDWSAELRKHRGSDCVSTKDLEALRNRATHDGIQRLMDVGIEARNSAEAAAEAFFQAFGAVGHELALEPRAQRWFERAQTDVAGPFASAFIR